MAKRLPVIGVITVVALLVLLLKFIGFFDGERIVSAHGRTMGTTWSVKYVTNENNDEQVNAAINKALDDVNQNMSTYIPDSQLMLLNKAPLNQPFTVTSEFFTLVEQAQHVSGISGGAYDITVGELVNLWGFGSGKSYSQNHDQSLSEKSLPDEATSQVAKGSEAAFNEWMEQGRVASVPDKDAIAQAMDKVGYQSLILDKKNSTITKTKPVFVDLSSIAKGYGVDVAVHAMEALGITSYMMEAGGEVRMRGTKPGNQPWRIAVREPVLESRINTIVSLDNMSIATSGDYLNYYEVDGTHFSHLIDARTGYPEKHRLASVAVVVDEAGLADAYATMFMILGEKKGIEVARREAIDAYFIYHTDEGFMSESTGNFDQYRLEP